MTGEFSFIIEASGPISDKVPHLCPFHSEKNPSAVTFFKADGRSFTFCSACGQKAWGQYEKIGNSIVVRVKQARITNREAPTVSVSSYNRGESESKLAWYKIIKNSVPPRGKPSQEILEFWEEYLQVKGVDPASLDQVEVRPIIFEFGVWFPISVIDVLGNIVKSPRFGVVRSIPYKSLNFFPDFSPNACAYVPCPSALDDYSFVVVVESPVAALRIAQVGWKNVIAALGTNQKLLNNIKIRHKVITIHDPDQEVRDGTTLDIISDIDKLTNEGIVTLMQMIQQ